MAKNKAKNKARKQRRKPTPATPPTPQAPKLTLPGPMTVEEIQTLNNLLDNRQVLIDFRDAPAGTLYVKRRDDPRDMEVGMSKEPDQKLREILAGLVSNMEADLERMGIDLSELDVDSDDDEEAPQDAEALAALLAEARETLAALKAKSNGDDEAGDDEAGDDEADDGDDEDAGDDEAGDEGADDDDDAGPA